MIARQETAVDNHGEPVRDLTEKLRQLALCKTVKTMPELWYHVMKHRHIGQRVVVRT